jgi:hypothetical protein
MEAHVTYSQVIQLFVWEFLLVEVIKDTRLTQAHAEKQGYVVG